MIAYKICNDVSCVKTKVRSISLGHPLLVSGTMTKSGQLRIVCGIHLLLLKLFHTILRESGRGGGDPFTHIHIICGHNASSFLPTYRFFFLLGLGKGLSKKESLELSFELRQSVVKISQTGMR